MRFFRWNSFTVIGLLLLLIGVYGLIKGAGFEYDAGLPAEPHEGLYYIIVGILMVVNGLVVAKPVAAVAKDETEPVQKDEVRRGKAPATVRSK